MDRVRGHVASNATSLGLYPREDLSSEGCSGSNGWPTVVTTTEEAATKGEDLVDVLWAERLPHLLVGSTQQKEEWPRRVIGG